MQLTVTDFAVIGDLVLRLADQDQASVTGRTGRCGRTARRTAPPGTTRSATR
jgi:hypothetical protein